VKFPDCVRATARESVKDRSGDGFRPAVKLLEQRTQLVRRLRPAEQVALDLGATLASNLFELIGSFNAFGGRDHAE
jgi:hypothetical protein